jgi:hypothetical protein
MTSKRWLVALSSLVVMLTIAGAVSFIHYVGAHKSQPALVAVAPFDIFIPDLDEWRVRLAQELTAQIDSLPPLRAVSQDVVRERWRGQQLPELAALDLARRTSAGIGIYGRIDPLASSSDSVIVRVVLIDAATGRVRSLMADPWARGLLPNLARVLAQQVRQNYP